MKVAVVTAFNLALVFTSVRCYEMHSLGDIEVRISSPFYADTDDLLSELENITTTFLDENFHSDPTFVTLGLSAYAFDIDPVQDLSSASSPSSYMVAASFIGRAAFENDTNISPTDVIASTSGFFQSHNAMYLQALMQSETVFLRHTHFVVVRVDGEQRVSASRIDQGESSSSLFVTLSMIGFGVVALAGVAWWGIGMRKEKKQATKADTLDWGARQYLDDNDDDDDIPVIMYRYGEDEEYQIMTHTSSSPVQFVS